jgi:hypothetical protein
MFGGMRDEVLWCGVFNNRNTNERIKLTIWHILHISCGSATQVTLECKNLIFSEKNYSPINSRNNLQLGNCSLIEST